LLAVPTVLSITSRPVRAKGSRGIARPAHGFDPERFVEDVRRARLESDGQGAVREVLSRAMSNPSEVLRGLGEPSAAGAQTLYHDEHLTILNIVWAPLMLLLPHNHRMWALLGIYTGREDNILWRSSGSRIEASGAESLSLGDVFELPDDAIHSVTNPIKKLTGAIHIYGGDFFETPRSEWDPATLTERPFDLDNAMNIFRESEERFNCPMDKRKS
jgi:predicted metal-dependent enzyme (double-stranded beta helix superfamily)